MDVKDIVEKDDTRAGRAFDLVIQGLILVSLATFSLETLPDLPERWRSALSRVEAVVVVLFTLEYLLRVLVADRKLRFVFSFFGLVDLAAILPFYLMIGFDLRAVRVVRLLRIFRAFKLFRYSEALDRIQQALRSSKEELVLFLFAAIMLLYLSGLGIYYFERGAQPEVFGSVFHSLWWAVATLTTVGYGDVYPVTVGGKLFTFIVLMLGLGIVAVPTGIFASALSEARENPEPPEESSLQK